MFFSLSANTLLICLRILPLQCLLSSPYQMSSCRQRAGTAYRCVHEGTVTERHPLAANTDLRQHPAHDCLTSTCSLPYKKQTQTVCSSSSSSMQFRTLTRRKWNTYRSKPEVKSEWKTGSVELGYFRSLKSIFPFFFQVLYHKISGIFNDIK